MIHELNEEDTDGGLLDYYQGNLGYDLLLAWIQKMELLPTGRGGL